MLDRKVSPPAVKPCVGFADSPPLDSFAVGLYVGISGLFADSSADKMGRIFEVLCGGCAAMSMVLQG